MEITIKGIKIEDLIATYENRLKFFQKNLNLLREQKFEKFDENKEDIEIVLGQNAKKLWKRALKKFLEQITANSYYGYSGFSQVISLEINRLEKNRLRILKIIKGVSQILDEQGFEGTEVNDEVEALLDELQFKILN